MGANITQQKKKKRQSRRLKRVKLREKVTRLERQGQKKK